MDYKLPVKRDDLKRERKLRDIFLNFRVSLLEISTESLPPSHTNVHDYQQTIKKMTA
jgi:hypothetical protein